MDDDDEIIMQMVPRCLGSFRNLGGALGKHGGSGTKKMERR